MSTKLQAPCPRCDTLVMPTDKVVAVPSSDFVGTYPVKLWRYVCDCGYIWANELQRKHNYNVEKKARIAFNQVARYE
jgi:hypothetical protein